MPARSFKAGKAGGAGRAGRLRPRARIAPEDFPALAQFLAGYLHQDFPAIHGTPQAALIAFRAEATIKERRAFAVDAQRFLAATATLSWPAMKRALAALGGAWAPPSRLAVERLLSTRSPK